MGMQERPMSGLLASFGFAIVCLSSVGSAADTQSICRSAGQLYAEGVCICMDRPGGAQQRACCGMVLNNPSWQFTGEGCPVPKAEPAAAARIPTLTGDGFDVAPEIAVTGPGGLLPNQRQ